MAVAVIEQVGPAIGFAHGGHAVHPDRVRRNGLLDLGFPVDADTASWRSPPWHGPRRRHVDGARPGAPAAGYDGVISIEHEDPRMTPEEGVETSLATLRRACQRAEAAA
jgi:sugar phosphate isomerase/epimerase